jgi:drug/metabolite transporter (DMT)-like permease
MIAFAWGIPPIVHRFLTKTCHIPMHVILLFSALTYIIAVCVMILYYHRSVIFHEVHHHRRWIPLMVCTSFLSMFIANVLYLHVVKHASNINIVTIITAMYPVVTVILSAVLLGEHLTPMGIVGFFLVLIGMSMMIYKSKN